MTDMPVLPILLLTKYSPEREGIAERTLKTIATLLDYPGGYKLYIADGSANIEHAQNLDKIWANLYGGVAKIIHLQNTAGVVWNAGIAQIFADGHQWYYRSEDDFLLKENIDLAPYAQILLDRDDVGMVRLGLMPDGLNLRSIGWTDSTGHPGIYFDCLPTTPYAYSGNPGIVHKRLHDVVGYFHEEHNPGDIEIDFDYRVRVAMEKGGPRIWMPFALGGETRTYGVFNHVGEVKSYESN
jgi:hypothetical protein